MNDDSFKRMLEYLFTGKPMDSPEDGDDDKNK